MEFKNDGIGSPNECGWCRCASDPFNSYMGVYHDGSWIILCQNCFQESEDKYGPEKGWFSPYSTITYCNADFTCNKGEMQICYKVGGGHYCPGHTAGYLIENDAIEVCDNCGEDMMHDVCTVVLKRFRHKTKASFHAYWVSRKSHTGDMFMTYSLCKRCSEDMVNKNWGALIDPELSDVK